MIKTIRELTGLSHEGMGLWLGVSRSMVQFVESGERSLTGDAHKKLTALTVALPKLLQQAEAVSQNVSLPVADAEKLALKHRIKMEDHLDIARKQQERLDKLKLLHKKLTTRLALIKLMTEMDTEFYKSSERDDHKAGLLEYFNQEHLKHITPKLAPLQHSIDKHRVYAAAHGQLLAKYEAMLV